MHGNSAHAQVRMGQRAAHVWLGNIRRRTAQVIDPMHGCLYHSCANRTVRRTDSFVFSASCLECAAGSVGGEPAATSPGQCIACGAGTYSASNGTVCLPCPGVTFPSFVASLLHLTKLPPSPMSPTATPDKPWRKLVEKFQQSGDRRDSSKAVKSCKLGRALSAYSSLTHTSSCGKRRFQKCPTLPKK